jgi:hypothetical protein
MPGGISYIGDLTIQEDGGEITSQSIGDKALKTTCADADTLEVSSTGKLQLKERGSSLANGVGRADVSKFAGTWIKGSLTASDAAGGVFSEENSYGSDLVVLRVVISVSTGASDSSVRVDVGTAANATTSADTLIDNLNVSDVGLYDTQTNKGTNGNTVLKWGNNQFINASRAAGATSGLVGTYAIQVIDMN